MLIVLAVVALIIILILTFKYPPIALILFLTAGLVKGSLMINFQFFGVLDYTVLCAILVLVTMAYSFIKRGGPLREIISIPLGIYLLLAGLLLFGLGYTSAPNYGLEKSSRFATFSLIAFLAPTVFADRLRDIRLIMGTLLSAGIILSVGTIIAPQASVVQAYETARGSFLESNPLDTATKVGTAATIAFCLAIMAHTSKPLRIFSVAAVCVMMVGIIFTQSRGPFLSLVSTWLAAIFICRRGVSKGWQPFIVGAIVAATIIAFISLPSEVTSRITNIWRSSYDTKQASLTRTDLYAWAIERFPERPVLGHGTGAWAVDRENQDITLYPHNIILELLYEQGLVGAALIILFIWFIFRRWRQASRLIYLYEPHIHLEIFQLVHIGGLMFLFTLLEAMFSFDINGNRLMFFCAGLVLAVFNWTRRGIGEVYADSELITSDWEQLEGGGFQDAEVLYRG
jgi:O-antigen ligase